MGSKASKAKEEPSPIDDIESPIPEEEVRELIRTCKIAGFNAVVDEIIKKQSAWKNCPVNIAVTGETGAGKSSFINAMRGLNADCEGAAKVGVTETTTHPEKYPHPDNSNLLFWDLPGVGTMKYKPDDYPEKMKFEKFDFFVIVSSGRFSMNDIKLALAIKQRHQRFCFFRSKFEDDLRNDKAAHPNTFEAEKTMENMRDDITINFKQMGTEDMASFIGDSYAPEKHEFPALLKYIIDGLPELQRVAFTFSLRGLSAIIHGEKEKALIKRVWIVALISAGAGAIPVPGLSFAVDIGILIHEIKFYREQFGLDGNSIRELAKRVGKDPSLLCSQIRSAYGQDLTTKAAIAALGASLKVSAMAMAEFAALIPLIGSYVAATASFTTTSTFLRLHLRDMRIDGDRVLAKAFEI